MIDLHLFFRLLVRAALAFAFIFTCYSWAAEVDNKHVGIVGKNNWLYYQYELTNINDAPDTNASIDLIRQFNQILKNHGIALAVVMVPIKMRIYAEYLPDDIKINDYMLGNYDRMQAALQSSGVTVFDLNSAFLKSPMRTSDMPLFFRLDTHWSITGAMLGAETIAAQIPAHSTIKTVLDQIPTRAYQQTIGKTKLPSKGRDILQLLPPDSAAYKYPFDRYFQVSVSRVEVPNADLLGQQVPVGIALVGSSYSMAWTGFANALRFALQKDIFSQGISANQGSWVGMESYLRDDTFQIKPPKLLIWELPERDMRAPPDYKFREARYISNNADWLKRVSSLVNKANKP